MTDHDRASNRAGNPPLYVSDLTDEEIAEIQRNMQPGVILPAPRAMLSAEQVTEAQEMLNSRGLLHQALERVPKNWSGEIMAAVQHNGNAPFPIRADLLRAFLKRCDDDLVKELRELGVDVAYLED